MSFSHTSTWGVEVSVKVFKSLASRLLYSAYGDLKHILGKLSASLLGWRPIAFGPLLLVILVNYLLWKYQGLYLTFLLRDEYF